MKKIIYFVFAVCVVLFSSCANNRHFIRADVIGFSDEVRTSYDVNKEKRGMFSGISKQDPPYNLLTFKNGNWMPDLKQKDKINAELSAPRGNMTAADYAMVLAAKRVNYVRRKIAKNDPNTKYYIFLLTDGLDNYSPTLAKEEHDVLFTKTPEKYQKRVQKKLKRAMGWFSKNKFEVYPMIYLGEDMQETKKRNSQTDEQFDKYIDEQMEHFRYSSVGEAPKVIKATDYNEIIENLRKQFISSSYTFRVSKTYVGKQIRMSFVNKNGDTATLTGTLTKKLFGGYTLQNFKIEGIQIDNNSEYIKGNGQTLASTEIKDGNAYFIIEDLRYGKDLYFPDNSRVEQEIKTSGIWQLNSEYDEDISVSSDTYFMIVIDGSYSLDGKNKQQNGFEKEKKLAKEIVDMLLPSRNK